ncbi:hypothetical protein AKJ64_04840 [candidate division MSBL1 archaeon SCGC-AAA259E17]|uniref:Glycosyltransferase 2-like domain-containing protein n=1 Tax=candidate division MSBL1 archaeon SCGC-AAA259E17 TaxID=1698263 RepID=A0A133UAN5_9EURY|nr:hypothetical protein AKJ64_04840 [candidate division MSBL1 archaeon SCGC-AAA259E17]
MNNSEKGLVSVVICTRNREKSCKKAIRSVLRSFETSNLSVEIIVVDDCSDKPFTCEYNPVKVLRVKEEPVTTSIARNLGIQKAGGEITAFIDDDVLVAPTWASRLQKFSKGKTDILGGSVKPLYLSDPPDWWKEEVCNRYIAVGNIRMANSISEEEEHTLFWSCNLAVKSYVLEEVGFDSRLGKKGSRGVTGEDTELAREAREKGYDAELDPAFLAYHKVYPYRLQLSYLMRRAFFQGITDSLTKGNNLETLIRQLFCIGNSAITFPFSKLKNLLYTSTAIGRIYSFNKGKGDKDLS